MNNTRWRFSDNLPIQVNSDGRLMCKCKECDKDFVIDIPIISEIRSLEAKLTIAIEALERIGTDGNTLTKPDFVSDRLLDIKIAREALAKIKDGKG